MRGPLEIRAAPAMEVSWPNRMVEVVVMPYESPGEVFYQGRMITEICERGAYDGIQRRTDRVKANRDHDFTKPVGRAVAFYPSRDVGLVADIRISPGQLGDETLALADDRVLDASAGYYVMDDGEQWNRQRTERRLTKVWLDHVAFTMDPAFKDAGVLSVRSAEPATVVGSSTPLLDKILAERMAVEYRLD